MFISSLFIKNIKIFIKSIFILSSVSFIFVFPKTEILFSPKGNITKKLIEKIDAAKSRVYVAVYFITSKNISESLIRAKNKHGVDVQIITDQSCLKSPYGKVNFLKDAGIDVFIYKNNLMSGKYYGAIMHNKFAIIDDLIWTGSFNWTQKANTKNYENIVIIDDKYVCQTYLKEFRILKKKCNNITLKRFKNKQNKNRVIKSKTVQFKKKLLKFLKIIRSSFNRLNYLYLLNYQLIFENHWEPLVYMNKVCF